MAAFLHSAQHRATGQQPVEAVKAAHSLLKAAQKTKLAPSIGKNDAESVSCRFHVQHRFQNLQRLRKMGFLDSPVSPHRMSQLTIAAQILKRYASGDRLFEDMDLDGEMHDFSNTDLSGASFSRSFIFATFRNSNLESANFSNSNVKTCDFSGTNLKGSLFQGAAIDAAVFDGAELAGASFEGASEQGHIYGARDFPMCNAG